MAAVTTEKKNAQKIQDAHEAIRPTDPNRIPLEIKDELPRDLFRLYQLIWKRFVASRMSAARYDTVSVKIQAGEQVFTMSASSCSFDGFMSVYTSEEDKEEENVLSGALSTESVLDFVKFEPKQHFTQPPAHYTEASLVAGAGGAWNRASQYLCADHNHNPCKTLYYQGKQESVCDGAGRGCQQYDEGSLPEHCGCEFHS